MRALAILVVLGSVPAWPQVPESCCTVDVRVETATGLPVADASVRIESGAIRYSGTTGPDGHARLSLRSPGAYSLAVEAGGFYPAGQKFEIARDQVLSILVVMSAASTRRETVTVEERTSPLDPDQPGASASGAQLRSLPERIADVRNALPLLPGVVRTPEGKLQISGAPEYRSTLLVNAVDVTSPATASFGPTVPIDIVETLQVYKSPFLAEFGRFSAGVVAVTTRRGGDRWHYELNDPTPEFRIRSRHIRGIRGFTPRFAATGPVVRNKLYFAGAGSFELRKRPVYPLPFPRNEEKQQAVNAYVQFDYLRSPSHLVSLSLHGVPQRANFVGLDFYMPQPAAPSWKAHEYRASLRDDFAFSGGALLQSILSVSENRSLVGAQGDEPLRLTPVTTLGNYPFRIDYAARRAQWAEVVSLPVRHAAGRHHVKAGLAASTTRMHGHAPAGGNIVIEDLAGNVLSSIGLSSRPAFRLSDTDVSLFVQDGWEPGADVRLDLGLRADWQRVTGLTRAAPRAGFAWMPFERSRTVLRTGFGWFFDRVPLLGYAWPSYPQREAQVNRIGSGDSGPLAFGASRAGAFAPRSTNWSAAVDQPLGRSVLLHAAFYESRSKGLLILDPRPEELVLAGRGSARTRSLDLIARFAWYPEQTWVVSYVATRGEGDLNTFLDIAGGFPEPVIRPNLRAQLPAIVPHRFLTWGVFPVRYGLRLSPMMEWRSGFPWSALDLRQAYSGVPNSRRFPRFFSLDARISKDIAARGHKVRLSFSMFNITDHGNFDAVRLNTADPQFGEFPGRRPRRFRLDFDWLF